MTSKKTMPDPNLPPTPDPPDPREAALAGLPPHVDRETVEFEPEQEPLHRPGPG